VSSILLLLLLLLLPLLLRVLSMGSSMSIVMLLMVDTVASGTSNEVNDLPKYRNIKLDACDDVVDVEIAESEDADVRIKFPLIASTSCWASYSSCV